MIFFPLVLIIVVVIYLSSINNRLNRLEQALGLKKSSVSPNPSVDIKPTAAIPQSQHLNQEPMVSAHSSAVVRGAPALSMGPTAPNRFGEWLKEDWLMKLGALLFIIGCGWFVSYAFANNWIGPIGRITIGIAAGVLIMVLGFWRMIRYPSQGAVFMALGAGIAILTIFAGRAIYGFFTPVSAILFDFIIAAFVSFASYKFNVRSLAFSAQVLAFMAPLLTAGRTDSLFLFSYLFLISLATVIFASAIGWRALIISSLIFVGLYSIPYIEASGGYSTGFYTEDAPLILNFAYLFAVMYLFVGMFAVIRKGVESVRSEVGLATLNGLFLFIWIYNVATKEWQTLLFAAWAIVFAVGSFIAFRFSAKPHPFYAYGSVAVAFIAAATASQLNGAALTIAFTVEVLMLVITVLLLTKNMQATISTSFLFIVPALLSFTSMGNYGMSPELFTKDFSVLILMAVALIFAGRFIDRANSNFEPTVEKKAGAVLIVFGTLYIWFTIWVFIHILMRDTPDMATMVTLLIYTVAGLTAYFAGLYGNDAARRFYGAALLVFVVGRLVLIDVWTMELFGRVITFFAIGILLMSTAFLTKKKKSEVVGTSSASSHLSQ